MFRRKQIVLVPNKPKGISAPTAQSPSPITLLSRAPFEATMEESGVVFFLLSYLVSHDTHVVLPTDVQPLLHEFVDVFPESFPPNFPPLHDIQHYNDLVSGAVLPNRPYYRMSPKEHEELRRQVEDRVINKITLRYRFPIPGLDDLLKNGYHKIRIHMTDEWKTAFKTREVFVVYFNDILIYSANPAVHLDHLHEVLLVLHRDKFYTTTAKCAFLTNSIQFLGYVVSRDGLNVDPSKQFTFVIKHKAGVSNRVADALNHRHGLLTEMRIRMHVLDSVLDFYMDDPIFSQVLAKIQYGEPIDFVLEDKFLFCGLRYAF
ncbi:hypothetical protein Tco_1077729 [Tanacetum coccineum]